MTALQLQIRALQFLENRMGSACRGAAQDPDAEALLKRNTESKQTDEDEKETIEAVGHVQDKKGSGSLNEGTRKHEPVPTPSMKEINAAMENLYMYTNTEDGGEKVQKELLGALPTMGDVVSNLHLKMANPLGGLSANPNDPATQNNLDPRSTMLRHPTPTRVNRLHLEEGASVQEPNDTKRVFAPRQITGDEDTEAATTDNEELRDDEKHHVLDDEELMTEDTESAYDRNETANPPKKRGVGFNMDLNTKVDPKEMTESDTDIGAPDPQQMLSLQYDDTTLNEESSDEEDRRHESKPTHSSLLREQSNWKWQHSEINAQERAMAAQMEKLKAQNEEADLKATITYYRQQSGGNLLV